MHKCYVVGLGPGDPRNMTPAADAAIRQSDVIVGYDLYVQLIAPLTQGKQVLSIQEEVELLQSYLKIQQMRFRDSVQVEYEIAREVLTYRTIKLLLQPLVENAIHHARKEEEVLHIAVRIQKEERDVVFQVTDDGCGIEAEKLIKLRSSLRRSEEGYGLRNVANRVRLAYGEDYGVRIESQEGYGTTVSVRIPVNE